MEKVELGSWYTEDMEDNAEKIIVVSKEIDLIIYVLSNRQIVAANDMHILMLNIETILSHWVRNTYVGHNKEIGLRNAYQKFFKSLHSFILQCRTIPDKRIQKLAKAALYQGTLYRYLGHEYSNYEKSSEKIEPEYNEVWVSWSKNKKNSYIESKLYGTITRITCHTSTLYEIDLSVFGVSAGNEEEVVYPTIADQIDKIEYLEESNYK